MTMRHPLFPLSYREVCRALKRTGQYNDLMKTYLTNQVGEGHIQDQLYRFYRKHGLNGTLKDMALAYQEQKEQEGAGE